MVNMKNHIRAFVLLIIGCAMCITACEDFIPDSRLDTDFREDQASITYARLKGQGMAVYNFLPKGFDWLSNAMLASASDEAEYAIPGSHIERFRLGSWDAIFNPDNAWSYYYRGIRLANLFLKNSTDYAAIIVRDTTTQVGKDNYIQQVNDLKWLRNEARVLRAYYYFELIKRYGGVPLITEAYDPDINEIKPRSTFDAVVSFIIDQINLTIPELQADWNAYEATSFGRVNAGMAMALKSRVLLYWASPLNNPANNASRWQQAAQASHDVITYGRYSLAPNYRNLFLGALSHQSPESIFAYMTGDSNEPESINYPISTDGGATGNCPTGNLVDAYENANGTPFNWQALAPGANPYANRDSRLDATIVVNNAAWNGRTIECWVGGRDGEGVVQASPTGYYLKKFLADNLNLALNQTTVHSWILFRYGEILLNYAEAMNEAYGPDATPFSDGRSARWAVNQVRSRAQMPEVVAVNTAEMRNRIKHERRIELAFEEHRIWDVRRWGLNDAKAALGAPIRGVRIVRTGTEFSYSTFEVGKSVFTDNMILYPIPQSEILLSNGAINQNPQW
jgi:starch-binding outer membrane protein, SusD/RagB family